MAGSVFAGAPLACPAAQALKGILGQHPESAAQIVASLNNSRTILAGLEQYEKLMDDKKVSLEMQVKLYEKVVEKFKGILVDPVKQFFTLVYDYKTLLHPIIKESLNRSTIAFEGSTFCNFLQTSKDKAATFFTDMVNTKDDLLSACQEFVVLFGDLEATMPEAFEAGREYLKELRQKREREQSDGA